MNSPIQPVNIQFSNIGETLDQTRDLMIKSILDYAKMCATMKDVKRLEEVEQFAKELAFYATQFLSDTKYGHIEQHQAVTPNEPEVRS